MQLASTVIWHSGPSDRSSGRISAVHPLLLFTAPFFSVPAFLPAKTLTVGRLIMGSTDQRRNQLPLALPTCVHCRWWTALFYPPVAASGLHCFPVHSVSECGCVLRRSVDRVPQHWSEKSSHEPNQQWITRFCCNHISDKSKLGFVVHSNIFSYFSCQVAGLQLWLSLVWRPNWRGFLCRSRNLRSVLSPKPDITCLFVNVPMVWESPVFGFFLHVEHD
jgi:hypothetical protein